MKVLFTADIHIKLGQKNIPVEWAKNRYRMMIDQIHSLILTHDIDLVVLGGDIFDKLPNMEELEVYWDWVSRLQVKTFIYAGNHEALKKNTTFLTNLKSVTNLLNKKVEIIDDFYSYENMDFIPYNKLKEYFPQDIDFHGDILFTHVRGEIPPHVKPEVPLEIFERWKYVLAGDLHSHTNSQRNILYPGSPVTTSFHRNTVDTGVIVFCTSTYNYTWEKLELPQLIRKTIKAGEEMPATDYHHTIYEVEGDMAELSNMENSELLDKKVVRRDTDTTLILSPELTLEEEVREYLQYVLQLNEDTISASLKELANNIGKLQE